jgi:hypothetical protein
LRVRLPVQEGHHVRQLGVQPCVKQESNIKKEDSKNMRKTLEKELKNSSVISMMGLVCMIGRETTRY